MRAHDNVNEEEEAKKNENISSAFFFREKKPIVECLLFSPR